MSRSDLNSTWNEFATQGMLLSIKCHPSTNENVPNLWQVEVRNQHTSEYYDQCWDASLFTLMDVISRVEKRLYQRGWIKWPGLSE